MKAERERRESILQAEGQKQSQILVAEGEKQSTILKADAEKQAAILHAEAERQAAVLRAEGEAEAIMKVQTALADSIKLLNSAEPQRSGRQAQGARILRKGRRRAGDEDHRSQRDPEPCRPCRQLQGSARGREEVNPAPRKRAPRRSLFCNPFVTTFPQRHVIM